MAKSAVTELTDQIEAIRQEAYQEGYAAAMRAIIEFSNPATRKPKATGTKGTTSSTRAITKATPPKAASPTTATARVARPARQQRPPAKPPARQARRGDNARYIAEAMQSLPDQTGPAAAIKKALAEKGHDLPYTSIRHGLGQLQARGEASVAEDGRTWKYSALAP